MKAAAYRAVRSAIERGDLIRPESCQHCGTANKPCADGRSRLQAHHRDYSKPLEVEWICAACHRKETPLPANRKERPEVRGQANCNAKLTSAQASEIRASKLSGAKLAELYGVHRTRINSIKRGDSYVE